MRRCCLVFAVLAVAGITGGPAVFAAPPAGKTVGKSTVCAEASVSGRTIRLRDVAAGNSVSGPLGDVVLGAAPLPGRSCLVSAGEIRYRVRAAGLDPAALTLPAQVKVTATAAASGEPAGKRAAEPVRNAAPVPARAAAPATNPEQAPVVVAANARVRVRAESGVVEITTFGIASEAGRPGQTIRVRLLAENGAITRTVRARVESAETVVIEDEE